MQAVRHLYNGNTNIPKKNGSYNEVKPVLLNYELSVNEIGNNPGQVGHAEGLLIYQTDLVIKHAFYITNISSWNYLGRNWLYSDFSLYFRISDDRHNLYIITALDQHNNILLKANDNIVFEILLSYT